MAHTNKGRRAWAGEDDTPAMRRSPRPVGADAGEGVDDPAIHTVAMAPPGRGTVRLVGGAVRCHAPNSGRSCWSTANVKRSIGDLIPHTSTQVQPIQTSKIDTD